MIDKTGIENLVREFISGRDIFLVSINVSTGNKITVLVNKKEGITIDECVALSRHIEGNLDRESEDFELQVSSPGLGEPLLVQEQYEMTVGRRVEVIDSEGKKINGIMKSFSGNSFIVEKKAGKKGIRREPVEIPFKLTEVRSVRELVTFKQ